MLTHAAIPPREYPDPSEPGSQARSGPASTRVGDHLGSPGAACFVSILDSFTRDEITQGARICTQN